MPTCNTCKQDFTGGKCPHCAPRLKIVTKKNSGVDLDLEDDETIQYVVPCKLDFDQGAEAKVVHVGDVFLDSDSLSALETLFVLPLDSGGITSQPAKIIGDAVKALASGELDLPLLYRIFRRHKTAKIIATKLYKMQLEALRKDYKKVKHELLASLLGTDKKEHDKEKEWIQKTRKIFDTSAEKKHYIPKPDSQSPLANRNVCTLDLKSGKSWFRCMIALSTIRKTLSQIHLAEKKDINHVTVLAFDGFSLFVLNTKTSAGGTTRMLWPMTKTKEISDKDEYTKKGESMRVLDMTYRDVHQLTKILQVFNQWTDVQLAKLMLGVLANDDEALSLLTKKTHSLHYQTCSFLGGVGLGAEYLSFAPGKIYLTRRARGPKKMDLLSVAVTPYEAICYILSIIFLAEPRHALGMWRATLIALEMVASGHLTFWQLFSSLGGTIEYGRLLPGANVLGKALDPKATLQQKAIQAHELSLMEDEENAPKTVLTCSSTPKRLAMPLVDSVLYALKDEVEWNYDKAVRNIAEEPIYQPLMKVIFLELLHAVARNGSKNYDSTFNDLKSIEIEAKKLLPPAPKPTLLPPRARQPGSDQLFALEGYTAYGVINDADAPFRALALYLDRDQGLFAGYRNMAAAAIIGMYREQGKLNSLHALLIYGTMVRYNLGQVPIEEVVLELKDANLSSNDMILPITFGLAGESLVVEKKEQESFARGVGLAGKYCGIEIWIYDTNGELIGAGGPDSDNPTRIVFDAKTNKCHLLISNELLEVEKNMPVIGTVQRKAPKLVAEVEDVEDEHDDEGLVENNE